MGDFAEVGVADELEAGYFDYDDGCTLSFVSAKQVEL